MFDVLPLQKYIKLHIPFVWSSARNQITLSKLSPVLNQMGVFDSQIADLLLEKFSNRLDSLINEHYIYDSTQYKRKKLPVLRFSFGVVIYLLKKKKTRSIIFVLGPNFGDILKRFFNTSLYAHSKLKMRYLSSLPISMTKEEFLKLLLFHMAFFNFEDFSFYYFIRKSFFIKSVLLSYRFR